jgi:hypothetical protein
MLPTAYSSPTRRRLLFIIHVLLHMLFAIDRDLLPAIHLQPLPAIKTLPTIHLQPPGIHLRPAIELRLDLLHAIDLHLGLLPTIELHLLPVIQLLSVIQLLPVIHFLLVITSISCP